MSNKEKDSRSWWELLWIVIPLIIGLSFADSHSNGFLNKLKFDIKKSVTGSEMYRPVDKFRDM